MVWERIDEIDAEEVLTEEERQQLQSDEGYITGGEAKREFGLRVDLPSALVTGAPPIGVHLNPMGRGDGTPPNLGVVRTRNG